MSASARRSWTAHAVMRRRYRRTFRRLRPASALQDWPSQILAIFDSSPDAIVIHRDFKIVYANVVARRLFKADRLGREVIGMTLYEWVAPASLESASARIPLLYAGHSLPLTEQTHLAADGTPLEVEVAAAPIVLGDRPAAVVTLRDIRERKQAERALRESEARYRELFEHYRAMVELSPDAVTIHQDYRWVFANSSPVWLDFVSGLQTHHTTAWSTYGRCCDLRTSSPSRS